MRSVSDEKKRGRSPRGGRRRDISGNTLGLIMAGAVFMTAFVAGSASIHKVTSAADAEQIAPSVMVGAGTESSSDTEAASTEASSGGEDERLVNQTTMWLSSMAEGLDKVKPLKAQADPSDSSGSEALQAASSVGAKAASLISENHVMSYSDYSTLLNIVEAECTGGDEKSKLLVADVILNRVKDEHFPDTVYDVVWQKLYGKAQFSPTQDGRMGTLKITDSTVSAVDRAVEGEDISKGALFFMAREYSEEENVEWFDETLTYLFSYGGHDFYKFK